jgi:hypothetical protein
VSQIVTIQRSAALSNTGPRPLYDARHGHVHAARLSLK